MELTHKERILPPAKVTPSILVNFASVSNHLNNVKATSLDMKDIKVEPEFAKETIFTYTDASSPQNEIKTEENPNSEKSNFTTVKRISDQEVHPMTDWKYSTLEVKEKKRKLEKFPQSPSLPLRKSSRDKISFNSNLLENGNLSRNIRGVSNSSKDNPILDTPLSDCSDMDQLPLPAGFGEVELEAIRILGSFSQPRDSNGLSTVEGNSSINSSRAASVEYVSPQNQCVQPQLKSNSPIMAPRLMYDTSNQSSPISSRASSPKPLDRRAARQSRTGTTMNQHSEPVSPASSGMEESRSDEEGRSPGIFRCEHPSCGKTFGRLYNLKSHTRTHTDDRPFKCGQCEQAFSRNHDLKRHQKIHTGIKPFECAACGKKFSRMDALGRHRAKKPECLEKQV